MAGSRTPKRSRFGFSSCFSPRKNMERDSRIHLRNDAPNCLVSILYAIRAKKGLQHRRLGSGRKHAAGSGASKDDEASTDTGRAHKHRYARADKSLPTELAAGNQDGAPQNDSVTKSSLRSRIKAKLADEMSKKKGWHRRSNSLPLSALSKRIDFSTNAGSTDFNFGLDMKDEVQKLTDDNPCASSTTDSLVTDPTDESVKKNKMCELCAAKLSMSYWKRSEANQEVRHSIECNPFLHNDIVHSERFSEGSSVQDLNQLTDGLDVFGPRKEFFLKILHDPGTPFLQYLHSREAFKSKIGLTRSKSFPLPGSVSRIVLESTNNYSKQSSASDANERDNFQVCHRRHNSVDITRTMVEPSIVERKEVGTSGPILGRHRSFNSLTPCSPRGFKIEHENLPVVKRFKRLKKKIRHAIRESRKEKQRPVMNSVFQKVPYDSNSSKVMQEETDNLQSNTDKCTKYSGSSSCEVDQSTSALRKDCDNHRFRRATSFGESIDRYSRLFECTFDRGARYPVSEKSTLRAENVPTPGKSSNKSLERLFSLPNLKSSSTPQMDSYQSPAAEPLKTFENHVGMAEPGMLDEKKPSDCSVDQESQKRLDPAEDCATVEDLKEYSEAPTQSVNLNAGETTSHFQDNLEFTSVSLHSEPSPFYVADSDSKDITTSPSQLSTVEDSLTCEDNEITVVDTAVDIPKVESPLKQNYLEALQTQVDANHVSEFNYVKDILELSGFTGNKFLGTWNSTGQPVDPSVFEEVEGCPLTELDISEYEEVCSYNRLLMFDLINEVLIEIHNRSSSYFPVHLTCRSHISPMPVGYHVLGEVWTNMKWHLSWRPECYQSLDDAVGRDLDRGDGWMNLQFDAECVGLEIEDMVFDDLIDEMLYDDLLED
ncbi:hypothetical protein POM88_011631 [Heracleum sosnowskyi]|uniref:DUF4378 domain-containing protein n=1 Tax=Heracleum sosnowskyi TaxID=360622 RepID=A0AAD8IYP6_9APIA|nr:hypothetical protein POM88_011631 [Heracleum sosnowskyi]